MSISAAVYESPSAPAVNAMFSAASATNAAPRQGALYTMADRGQETTTESETETDSLDLIYRSDTEHAVIMKLWKLYGQHDDVAAANLALEYLGKGENMSLSFYNALAEFTQRLSEETSDPAAQYLCAVLDNQLRQPLEENTLEIAQLAPLSLAA